MDELFIKVLTKLSKLLNQGLYDECSNLIDKTKLEVEEGSFGLDEFTSMDDDDEDYDNKSYYDDDDYNNDY